MQWRIECKHSGTGFDVECGFDEALGIAMTECQTEWATFVVWLLPATIRMAEVKKAHVSWTKSSLTGPEVTSLMRRNRKTIEELSFRMGITQKRVRKVRAAGLNDSLAVRDWLEAITGEDMGPLPEKYHIKHWTEEGCCAQCGCPVEVGDHAFDYVGDMYCSVTCCRVSRGWGKEKVV